MNESAEPYAIAARGDTSRSCIGPDDDQDGLDSCFERYLADAFTPIYHVSQGEVNNFATFNDYVPQTVLWSAGQAPLSHYRVKPVGFVNDSVTGQQYGAIRIDYLTLWDRDNGLTAGGNGACFGFLPFIFDQMQWHDLDNERSAILVFAPTTAPNVLNTNANSYGAYAFYTAAHEGTIADKSLFFRVAPGYPLIPADSHLHLALSKWKHGTYPYNPNLLPLVPSWIINLLVGPLEAFCLYQLQNGFGLGDAACLAAVAALYDTFYGCAVEVFTDQGGVFAVTRFNVGEPNYPSLGFKFIQDNSARTSYLTNKLINSTFGSYGFGW